MTFLILGYMDPRAEFMQMESGNRHVDLKEEGEAGPQVDFYVSYFYLIIYDFLSLYIFWRQEIMLF